jgi:hypothetical protein
VLSQLGQFSNGSYSNFFHPNCVGEVIKSGHTKAYRYLTKPPILVVIMTSKPLIVTICTSSILTLALLTQVAFADGGLFHYYGDVCVSIYEPAQKAILAWNGTDEIMILSVDVKADENASAVRIIPFPRNPTIENASLNSFDSVQRLIDSYASERARQFAGRANSYFMQQWSWNRADSFSATPSLVITFHEKIGAHNITVVKANSSRTLFRWITNSFKTATNGQVPNRLPEDLQKTLEEYIRNGFNFFALDLIQFNPNQTSVEPLIYKFKTNFLYFPLKISSHNTGSSAINLFLFTSMPIDESFCAPFTIGQIRLSAYGYESTEPLRFPVSEQNLKNVDYHIHTLFFGEAWFSALEWNGQMASLKSDFKADQRVFVLSSVIRALQIAFMNFVFVGVIAFVVVGLVLCGGRRSRREKYVNPFHPQH